MSDDKKDWGPSILEGMLRNREAIRKDLGLDDAVKEACTHVKCTPEYDDAEAQKINDAWEIRKRFPRFWGTCPDCSQQVICYASFEHYIMGDW